MLKQYLKKEDILDIGTQLNQFLKYDLAATILNNQFMVTLFIRIHLTKDSSRSIGIHVEYISLS